MTKNQCHYLTFDQDANIIDLKRSEDSNGIKISKLNILYHILNRLLYFFVFHPFSGFKN